MNTKEPFKIEIYDDCGGISPEEMKKVLEWYKELCAKSPDYIQIIDNKVLTQNAVAIPYQSL